MNVIEYFEESTMKDDEAWIIEMVDVDLSTAKPLRRFHLISCSERLDRFRSRERADWI